MITLRPATPDDIDTLVALHAKAVLSCTRYPAEVLAVWSGQDDPDTRTDMARAIEDGTQYVVVAQEGDTLRGYGALLADGTIRAVYADPDAKGLGIGRRLMTDLETQATRRGHARVTLDASLDAVAFYKKLGYRGNEIEDHFFACGARMPCIPMAKALHLDEQRA